MASRDVDATRTHDHYTVSLLRRALQTATMRSATSEPSPTSPQPKLAKAVRRNAARQTSLERFVVDANDDEVVIRVRLDGARASDTAPAVITQRNCDSVGLTPRQFRELVRAGVIRGGRLPGTRTVAAKVEDVLRVVEQAAATSAKTELPPQHDGQDDVDAVLAAVGQQRRPGGR